MGAFAMGGLFVVPLAAVVIDRFSQKKLLILTMLLFILNSGLYIIQSDNYFFYTIPRFLQGALFTLIFLNYVTIIAHIVPQKIRSLGFTIFSIMGMLPFIISIGLGEIIFQRYHFQYLLALAGILSLAAAIQVFFIDDIKSEISNGTALSVNISEFIQILKIREIYLYLYISFAFGYVFGTIVAYYSGFILFQGLKRVRDFWIIFPLAAIIVRLGFGIYFDRYRRQAILVLPLLFLPIAFVLISGISDYNQIILPAILYGAAHGVLFPVLNAALIDYSPGFFRGRMNLLNNAFFNLGYWLCTIIGAFIINTVSLKANFLFVAIMPGIAFIALLISLMRHRKLAFYPD